MDVSHQAEAEKYRARCRRCRERISFLIRQEQKRHARAESERRQRTEETTRGRGIAECRNFGRKRERAQPAHRRARVVLEPCLAEFAFLVKLLAWERL